MTPFSPPRQTGSFSAGKEAFLRLLFPEHCAVCRELISLECSQVCNSCKNTLASLQYSFIEAICDIPLQAVSSAHTLYRYDSPIKEILHQVKFYKNRRLLQLFEEPLKEFMTAAGALQRYDAIIPVPIHFSRRLEREFNQAEIIAKMISKWTGIPIISNMLHKVCVTPSQNELSREERLANLWGSFRVRKKRLASSQSFLLVDDILTTGATAEEAARVLRQHGAKRVDFIALARTEIGQS